MSVINKKIYGAVEEMRRLKVILLPRVLIVCVSRNISLLYLFNNNLSNKSWTKEDNQIHIYFLTSQYIAHWMINNKIKLPEKYLRSTKITN